MLQVCFLEFFRLSSCTTLSWRACLTAEKQNVPKNLKNDTPLMCYLRHSEASGTNFSKVLLVQLKNSFVETDLEKESAELSALFINKPTELLEVVVVEGSHLGRVG